MYQLFIYTALGLLVDREMTDRLDRRLKNRFLQAKLKQNACLEDINYQADRGLDKALLQSLQDCQWIKKHLNVLITASFRRADGKALHVRKATRA